MIRNVLASVVLLVALMLGGAECVDTKTSLIAGLLSLVLFFVFYLLMKGGKP